MTPRFAGVARVVASLGIASAVIGGCGSPTADGVGWSFAPTSAQPSTASTYSPSPAPSPAPSNGSGPTAPSAAPSSGPGGPTPATFTSSIYALHARLSPRRVDIHSREHGLVRRRGVVRGADGRRLRWTRRPRSSRSPRCESRTGPAWTDGSRRPALSARSGSSLRITNAAASGAGRTIRVAGGTMGR